MQIEDIKGVMRVLSECEQMERGRPMIARPESRKILARLQSIIRVLLGLLGQGLVY